MTQGRVKNVEQAFEKILGHQLKVEIFCRTDLVELWEKVILVLEPLGNRAFMQQQGTLLFFNGNTAWIGINSKPLLNLAEKRVPQVESAFRKVLECEIKVHLEECSDTN